ncbi:MAG: HlyD family type I secretion periplasmic adaptor subunit [Magnetococcales bacterium]|nr:HlyD family type I secretion periplasmic adaptor subunit [Magnetococcales bacterium]
MLLALVAAFIGWAALGQLDVISGASGEVMPAGRVKRLQHLEGGIVKEILVKEGDRVKAEQPLILLDKVKDLSEVKELGTHILGLACKAARLRVEAEGGTDLIFAPILVKKAAIHVREEVETFKVRRSRLESQIAVQESLVAQRRFEMDEVKARIAYQSEVLVQVDEQVAISGKLLEQSLSNRLSHTERLKERARTRGEIGELKSHLLRLESMLKEEQARLEGIRALFREEARKELGETLRAQGELRERLKKLSASLARTVMRSPVNGVVKSLDLFARGEVVRAGETVMEIVPTGERLVIEARLPPGEIGFVRAGQVALLQLESGYASRVDKLTGQVTRVSPDSMVDAKGAAYYRVLIEAEKDHFTDGTSAIALFPGMKIMCSIRTGQRSILEYLLEPFRRMSDQALRER